MKKLPYSAAGLLVLVTVMGTHFAFAQRQYADAVSVGEAAGMMKARMVGAITMRNACITRFPARVKEIDGKLDEWKAKDRVAIEKADLYLKELEGRPEYGAMIFRTSDAIENQVKFLADATLAYLCTQFFDDLRSGAWHERTPRMYRFLEQAEDPRDPTSRSALFDEGKAAFDRGDFEAALTRFRPLADSGYAPAENALGLLYQLGSGVAKDEAEALKWYRKAAMQGDAQAEFNLALAYEKGNGVAQDDAEAVTWYRKSGGHGHAEAQNNLGVMYLRGRGVAQDRAEAIRWYRMSAAQGVAKAQYNLGAEFASDSDYAEALKWYRLAAAQDYGDALGNLGVMYITGRGVAKDPVEARRLFLAGAALGSPGAQYNIAILYADGTHGSPKDMGEAVKWWRKAAAQGHELSREELRRLNLGWE